MTVTRRQLLAMAVGTPLAKHIKPAFGASDNWLMAINSEYLTLGVAQPNYFTCNLGVYNKVKELAYFSLPYSGEVWSGPDSYIGAMHQPVES